MTNDNKTPSGGKKSARPAGNVPAHSSGASKGRLAELRAQQRQLHQEELSKHKIHQRRLEEQRLTKLQLLKRKRIKQLLIASGLLLLILLLLTVTLKAFSSKNSPAANSKSAVTTEKQKKSSSNDNKNSESAEEEPLPSPTPTPVPPVSLTVSVVGDCTLGTDENFDYNTSLNAYFYSQGKNYFMENVKSIFSADDLTIANLEGTLTTSDSRADKLYAFKGDPDFAQILSSGSIEAVNMANNHSHDYGEQSYKDTLATVKNEGITTFGYEETAVINVKGVKVGLVGIYELNDHLERTTQLKEHIATVKSKGAQLIIVIFHWGNEKETVPDTNQMTLGRLAIDEGADLVCGHHPHVLQGIETYKGKKIVYSLGNFCFGGNSAPSDMDSMIFQQTFTITADGVSPETDVNIIPCSISSASGYNNYQPTPSQGDEATRIMNKIEERSSWIPLPEHEETSSENSNSETIVHSTPSFDTELVPLVPSN